MRCTIDLDFDLVDDVCLACQDASITLSDLPASTVGRLGPLLEFAHIEPALNGAPVGQDWIDLKDMGALLSRRSAPTGWFSDDLHQGTVPVSSLVTDPLAWTAFIHRSREGAHKAGFASDHSAKLVAAIGEIYSNVVEHSGNVPSAYVAYRATTGQFEFAISDKGVGVLESLKSNPKYGSLVDSGAALELALQQGVSRHPQSDRGFGFVPLFVGLANISRLIRFRSGNHVRITNRDAGGNISSATRERARCEGFFCSVLCDLT